MAAGREDSGEGRATGGGALPEPNAGGSGGGCPRPLLGVGSRRGTSPACRRRSKGREVVSRSLASQSRLSSTGSSPLAGQGVSGIKRRGPLKRRISPR